MKLNRLGLGALIALSFTVAQAQTVYRIVGPDGKVSFSDKAPAVNANASATNARGQALPLAGGNASLPYELRQVAERYPVVLYTSADCGPCSSGRAVLTSRGVPFSERTVSTAEDGEALQRITGENTLPFLTIGGQQIKGFSDSEWSQFLDAAGYPKRSALPSGYRNGLSTPLVAVQRPAATAAGSQAAKVPVPVAPAAQPASPPPPPNPAGITF